MFFTPSKSLKSQNSEHGSIKGLLQYPNQDQDSKLQSGTPSALQSPILNLREDRGSLHL